MTLLQGVEAARLQIPPSRLQIRLIYRDALRTVPKEFSVEFEGGRRRFTQTRGGPAIRTLFDGSKASVFDGAKGVTIRDARDDTADPLFDPVLIGLTVDYSWNSTLSGALPYRTASKIEMIGLEKVADKEVWHVRLITDSPSKYQVDLWSEDKVGFRVYKYDLSYEGGHQTAVSYYDDNDYPWLPSRVETETYDANGAVRFSHGLSILKAEGNIRLSESTWTLGTLQLPVGAEVIDRRVQRHLGYWNGTGITPLAGPSGVSSSSSSRGSPLSRTFVLFIFGALAVAFVVLMWRSRKRVSPE